MQPVLFLCGNSFFMDAVVPERAMSYFSRVCTRGPLLGIPKLTSLKWNVRSAQVFLLFLFVTKSSTPQKGSVTDYALTGGMIDQHVLGQVDSDVISCGEEVHQSLFAFIWV